MTDKEPTRNPCEVCGKPAEQLDAIFCNACFYSGAHMAKALREGITLEYADGSSETIQSPRTGKENE